MRNDNLVFTNVNLATMTDGFGVEKNCYLCIRDGKIAAKGSMDDLGIIKSTEKDSQWIDLQERWLTPGLIDCHTHLVFGGNRADEFERRLNGETYDQIAKAGGGILSTVSHTRAASEDSLYQLALPRINNLIDQGVTALEIKSGYGLNAEAELKMLRVIRRLKESCEIDIKATFLGAHALPPEFKSRSDDYIDYLCASVLPQVYEEKLADAVDAFCEGIGFSTKQVEQLFIAAKKLGFELKLHADQLSDLGGAKLAAEYGALSADHIEYASEESVKAMKAANTVGVLLPGAFYFLKEKQKPPMSWLREYQVPMALATDCNPGSSPTESLLLMLNMACTFFAMTPEEALLGVTRYGAQALGIKDQGTIAPGNIANLAIWNIGHPRELSYFFGSNPCYGRVYRGVYQCL